MYKIIVLGLLVGVISSVTCPVEVEHKTQLFSDAFQIKSHETDSGHTHSLLYNYQFDEAFYQYPTVAFGINQFVSDHSSHMEIKITNTNITKDSMHFNVMSSSDSQWKSLKINFLSTTRNDLQFGVAELDQPHATNEQSFEVAYPLQSQFQTTGLKVKPFIQSFDLESANKQEIGIKLQDSDIEGGKIYLTFSNPKRVSLVRSLALCIIVFNIYTPGVLYADGIIDQNYVASKSQIHIPRHGISELRTYIVGINSFHASAAQPISISSAIDETFTLVLGPINRQQIDFISVSYLILSIIDCGSCAGYPVLFKGICKLQCPLGFTQRNGKCVPIVCSDGFEVGKNGICIPMCGMNEEYDYELDQCICIDNHFLINDMCVACPPGTYYNFRKMTCDSLCGANSYYQGGKCFCNPGYYVITDSCRSCPKGTYYDQQTQTCKSLCTENQVFNGQICVCKPQYYNISGSCQKCPPETIFDTLFGQCVCIGGKTFSDQLGKCVPICSQFQELVGEQCQCKDPYYRIQGVCGLCPKHSFYFFSDQKCYCRFGFRKVNGNCECPADRRYDEVEDRCVPRCEKLNQVFKDGECVCPEDYIVNDNGVCYPPCGVFQERIGGICRCIAGYHKGVTGPCVEISCPEGFQWNAAKRQCRTVCPGPNEIQVMGVCQCITGYVRELFYGVCQPACPNNQILFRGECICSPGNKIVDGVCTNCPVYSQYVNGVCICYNGNPPIDGECQKLSCPPNQMYDSISKSCKCIGPLVFMMGKCQYLKGCGQNEYWCGTKCVCHYGYVRMHGKCVKSTDPVPSCPPYSEFDPVSYKCVCQQGYYPQGTYICRKCSAGAYWDGNKCNNNPSRMCAQGYFYDSTTDSCIKDFICDENEYLQGLNCVCKTGFFFIDNKCQSCPYNSYFDGVSCVEMAIQQCNNPYKFWNGKACVCLPNFFEYGDSCVRCPANTVWNGLCCKIPSHVVGPLEVANGY